ncbi:hypothetical protein ACLOJK_028100 [Asimina triloba]
MGIDQMDKGRLEPPWLLNSGLIIEGYLQPAIDFVFRHQDCFVDIALLSTVATVSQFFISYTIRTFGALTFATIMTTRQVVVFGTLYAKSFLRNRPQKPAEPEYVLIENGNRSSGNS